MLKYQKISKYKKFNDKRGYFYEIYNLSKNIYKDYKFLQSNISFSKKNVLRGLHFQVKKPMGYLITVLSGTIFDVSVDLRKKSKNYSKYKSVIMSEKNNTQIFIPPGFAHGFYCLSENCMLNYACTGLFDPKDENGLNWKDPIVNIDWPCKKPILNPRDKKYKYLKELKDNELPK